MSRLVALLRSVNVGGRKLPMAELRALLVSLGLEDAVTYIQSGNAVFSAPAGGVDAVAARIEAAIAERFGLESAVIVRSADDLAAVAEGNPFLADEQSPNRLHVVFLEQEPAAGAVERLDPERSPPDRYALCGRELYLHLPNGAGRSKLTLDYLERRLGVRGTARNWSTVLKLLELARG